MIVPGALGFAWVSTVNYDFGDLPDTYATGLASDGARHIISGTPTLYLGSVAPDTEANGASGGGATGDDSAGVRAQGEDVVTVPDSPDDPNPQAATVTNNDFETGNLNGWTTAKTDICTGTGWNAYSGTTASSSPNRVTDSTANAVNTKTLKIRRTVVNNTGSALLNNKFNSINAATK